MGDLKVLPKQSPVQPTAGGNPKKVEEGINLHIEGVLGKIDLNYNHTDTIGPNGTGSSTQFGLKLNVLGLQYDLRSDSNQPSP